MSKLKMGSDFSDENQEDTTEGEVKKDSDEEKDENDTQSDSSTDENDETSDDDTQDGDEGSDEDLGDKDKLNALEGLRQTEKDLGKDVSDLDAEIDRRRQKISELRGQRRDKKNILKTIDDKIPESKDDDLSDIDPDSLQIIERVIKAKGYVSKDELGNITFEQHQKNAEKDFFAAHPEYLPANDADDALYTALTEELALYAKPKDPAQIAVIYSKAHKAVLDRFPDRFKVKPKINIADQKKNLVRNKGAGTGGGNSSGGGSSSKDNSSKGDKKLTDKQIASLRRGGWTEEDITRLNT